MDVPVNYVSVFAAAIAAMGLGFLWYGPIFGKQWKYLMGLTDESMKQTTLTPGQAMAGGFVMTLIMAYVLAHALIFASTYLRASGISAGLMAGFWNWLGFVVPVTAGTYLWEGKPLKLWGLNASYYLASLLIMGGILALWP